MDECLPDGISLEFKTFNLLPSESSCCFSYVKEVVDRFIVAGNGERFFPAFYDCVHRNNMFPNLNGDASLFLGFDLASHIVAYVFI